MQEHATRGCQRCSMQSKAPSSAVSEQLGVGIICFDLCASVIHINRG